MRVPVLFACLALPLLSAAQSSNSSPAITSALSSASQSASASGSGSVSGSGNTTASATISGNATTTAAMTSNLPTAPTTVAGANGDGPGGQAPSPGAPGSGGVYGPPDSYVASAEALRSAGLLGFVGLAVGSALVLV